MNGGQMIKQASFEKTAGPVYIPGAIKFRKKFNETTQRTERTDRSELSDEELRKDIFMLKGIPMVEMNPDKSVNWKRIAAKNLLTGQASEDNQLFEKFLFQFCPKNDRRNEQQLKEIKEIKQGLRKELYEANLKKKTASIKETLKKGQKVSTMLFAHGILSKGEEHLTQVVQADEFKKKSLLKDTIFANANSRVVSKKRSIVVFSPDESPLNPVEQPSKNPPSILTTIIGLPLKAESSAKNPIVRKLMNKM